MKSKGKASYLYRVKPQPCFMGKMKLSILSQAEVKPNKACLFQWLIWAFPLWMYWNVSTAIHAPENMLN